MGQLRYAFARVWSSCVEIRKKVKILYRYESRLECRLKELIIFFPESGKPVVALCVSAVKCLPECRVVVRADGSMRLRSLRPRSPAGFSPGKWLQVEGEQVEVSGGGEVRTPV